MEYVLQTHGLTKAYKGTEVVSDVNMTIQKGEIYGLIGLNGAGKTTLMRMITSLISASRGEIQLFGSQNTAEYRKQQSRISCVIESPAFYPNLTAVQNLEYYRKLKGIPERDVVKKALSMSGLPDTGKKKYRNFSLGMKQRMGLALAVMNHSDFIILDEPVNGLDPLGIVEFREIVKNLRDKHGITFMISSHILSELSQIATRYGIINQGKLIKQLSNDELREACQKSLVIQTGNPQDAAVILEDKLAIHKYKVVGKRAIRIYERLDDAEEIIYQLAAGGIRYSSASEEGETLEDYFTSLIGGNANV